MSYNLMIICARADKLNSFWLLEHYANIYKKHIKFLRRKRLINEIHIFVDEKKELFFDRLGDLCHIHIIKNASKYGSGFSLKKVCDMYSGPFLFCHGSIFFHELLLPQLDPLQTTIFSGLTSSKHAIGINKTENSKLVSFSRKSLEKWTQLAFLSSQAILDIRKIDINFTYKMYSFEILNSLLKSGHSISISKLKGVAIDTSQYKHHKTLLDKIK